MAEAVQARAREGGPRDSAPTRESAERFDPAVMPGGLLEAEHRARYWWATRFVLGKKVLDAGCGVGYGAEMLAAAGAREVIGADRSEEAIEAARERAARARFQVADLRNLPFETGAFDVVACFEVLEHIEERTEVVAELKRVLGEGGVLLVSSPNRRVYLPGNPHHVYEYEPEELRRELAGVFANVALYRQHAWMATAVMTDEDFARGEADGELGLESYKLARDEPGLETYTIAVASDRSLDGTDSVGVLGEPFEVRAWQKRVDELEEQARSLEELRQYVAWLEEKHARTVSAAAELRASLWEAHELLLQRDEELLRWQGEPEAQQALEQAGIYARSLESEIVTLKEYQDTLGEELAKLTTENRRLATELEHLKNTRVWRMATRYWASRDSARRFVSRRRRSGG